ncbi:MAG: methyltransferase domain-containing protein [Planctomycetota bacterium]|nr:MAG: methyltransferase domain-containing protein [Planctomycetota bacterium]
MVDWAARYQEGHTPWDLGGPHPELAARLDRRDPDLIRSPDTPARALVPGCGRGHDALALAEAGWRVTALDIVPALAPELAPALEKQGGRFQVGDALAYQADPPFDLLFEHTFFCALAPAKRPIYGHMAQRILRPGGRLAAIVFPIGREPKSDGPPYSMTVEDLSAALGSGFRLLENRPVAHPGKGRAWPEVWADFERLDS